MSNFFSYVAVFLTLFATIAFPIDSFGQQLDQTKISCNWKNFTLRQAFSDIQSQSDLFFTYTYETVGEIRINNQNDNVPVADILKFISGETGLRFKISNDLVYVYEENYTPKEDFIIEVPTTASLATVLERLEYSVVYEVNVLEYDVDEILRGKVLDEKGYGLAGATILVKESGQGTISNENGTFSIPVPNNQPVVLVLSFVGYETLEVPITSVGNIEVALTPISTQLNEVVVIGYGRQSITKVNGATTKISGLETNKYAAASFDQQLIGTLAGVQINQVNGQPGSDAQVVIRGLGTLTAGSNPLIVVDGVPLAEGSTLSSISPSDIESINILKDAASAAIYGSRAGNGVILITTKSGQAGKLKVSLDFFTGIQTRADNVEFADAYSAAQFFTEARDWGYVSRDPENRSATDDEATRIANGANKRELRLDYLEPYLEGEEGLTNTDWLDIVFREAAMTNAALSFSGGNESGNYYVSANYLFQDGLAIGTDFERFSSAVKINSKIGERFKFGFSLNPSFSRQDYTNLGDWRADPIAASMTYYPFFDAYNSDGSIALSQGQLLNTPADGSLQENPIAYTQIKDDRFRFRLFGNTSFSYKIAQGLELKTILGGDYRNYFFDFFKASTLGEYRAIAPVPAKASETNGRLLSYISENTLSYHRIFNEHEIDLIAGYTYQREDATQSVIVGTNIQDDLLDNVSGASDITLNTDRSTWVQISYLGRLQYFFKERYQFAAAIRRDGSSRFGDDSKWGLFPSFSAGWIFSEESFFPSGRFVNFAKLRASWGVTGNNQIGSYSSKALLAVSNYVYDGTLGPGFASSTSPNSGLSWETNTSFNIGIDFGFWNKLIASANYYRSVTSDLLLNVPVPQQSGFSSSLQNIGEVENKGLELELSIGELELGVVQWSGGFNLTTNSNKVLALAEGQEEIRAGSNGAWRTKVGGPIAEITAYNIIGVYKTQDEIDESPHLEGTLTGDLIVEDVNQDGIIDDDDKIPLGTFAPELTFGFSSNFTWKNFDFSFAINGVRGRSAYFYDEGVITGVGEGFGAPSRYYMENRYHPENNPDGFLGQPNLGNFSAARRNTRVSSLYIQDADYTRIRFLQLGYTLPKKLIEKIGIESLRVYLTANNPITITNYRGYNPDSSEYRRDTDVLRAGYAQDNYPAAKSFLFGVNVLF
ncbi:MAG: TonB-dependent receptor [Bacteroidota bacterium]